MSLKSAVRVITSALLCLVIAAACSAVPGSDPGTSTPSSKAPAPSASPAVEVARPAMSACYRLRLTEALAPTSAKPAVPCRKGWTSRTFYVGKLDALVADRAQGHLFAVDAATIQTAVAKQCPARLAAYLGGSADDLHLSVLRAVWFTPTVSEADAGANWFRCDVVALATPTKLGTLTGNPRGVLAGDFAEAYGLCGTSKPDAPDFQRVSCASEHAWRAISTVDLDGPTYAGNKKTQAAGVAACTEAARATANDALDFQWGYEWPTRAQWESGQTYGVCWAPADGS